MYDRLYAHFYAYKLSYLSASTHPNGYTQQSIAEHSLCSLRFASPFVCFAAKCLILRFATYQQADGYAFGLIAKPSATPLSLPATPLRLTLRRLRITPTDTKQKRLYSPFCSYIFLKQYSVALVSASDE